MRRKEAFLEGLKRTTKVPVSPYEITHYVISTRLTAKLYNLFEGLVGLNQCRFKSCFPHSLRHKDLRRSGVSPFLLALHRRVTTV
jgi:hypothetical protein